MSTKLLLPLVLLLLSCSDDGGTMMVDPGRRPDVLANLGENVFLPTYRDFATRAETLVTATDAYATTPGAETKLAAQQAWLDVMEVFEEVELMQIGPLAPMADAAGGRDMRFELYAWPSLNRCVVDQDTASALYDDPASLQLETFDRRGLGAIEYLLFIDTTENACSPLSPINEDGTWAALGPEMVEARRGRHAHSLAVIVRDTANALVTAWDDGFLLELTDPTRMGALYGSAQEGLQAVVDGLFYLDTETKDMKVAEPAGIMVCTMATCPDSRESRHANVSMEHILANVRGFQRIYLGGDPGADGLGFDDLLRDLGAEASAEQLELDIEAAIAAIEAVEGNLNEALVADLPSVMAVYDAIKRITDHLKTMMLTILDLEAPDRAAGDND
jgi:predicted lipoprotein